MLYAPFLFLSSVTLLVASQYTYADSLHLPKAVLSDSTCSLEKAFSPENRFEVCLLTRDSPVTEPPSSLPAAHSFGAEPWTETPSCIRTFDGSNIFCVYTSSTFAGGRGISLFTTPFVAEQIAQSPAFINPNALEGINVLSSPPYVSQPLPGRGIGLIMNRTLHRGDNVFSHSPVLIIHRATFDALIDKDRLPFQHAAVNHLPKASREMFLALHGHFGGDHVDDVIRTNSFQVYLGENEEPHNIILPETSRLNHDCRPNAHYYFNENTLSHHVHAIRTIRVGEELTISYIDEIAQRSIRQELIKLSWGFDCSCSLCSQREFFIRESDKRLQLISDLEDQLGDWTKESTAHPKMAETLISLYQQERLHASIAVAYTHAALAYNTVRDEHTALKYAALAVEFGILNAGPDDLDLHAMQQLMESPKDHWSWGIRIPPSAACMSTAHIELIELVPDCEGKLVTESPN